MFLIDTNAWLEVLLEQEKAGEARSFLRATEARRLYITEFSLYSIGVITTRLKRDELFSQFVTDVLEESLVNRVRLETEELKQLVQLRKQYNLDFDDAYQLTAALRYKLVLVSFDGDFDRTEPGRKTPAQCMNI